MWERSSDSNNLFKLAQAIGLVFFFILLSFPKLQAQVPLFYPSEAEDYWNDMDRPQYYLLADSVILRRDPNRSSTALDLLRIGQGFFISGRSGEIDTINGLAANWYYIEYPGGKGYIWGGFISLSAAGSQGPDGVRFYYGLSRQAKDSSGYMRYYAQIRAVKGQKVLDRKEFLYNPNFELPRFDGPNGLALHDIIYWHLPCEGGCGCSTGEYYLFWDGKQFSDMYTALGTADAWASGGSVLYFPSHMLGEPGLIIRYTDDFLDETEEGYLRYWSREYFHIVDGKMLPFKGKATERKEYLAKD